jgi:hypothetical protein
MNSFFSLKKCIFQWSLGLCTEKAAENQTIVTSYPHVPEYFLLVLVLLEVDGDGLASPDVGAGVGALHAEYAHIPTIKFSYH